MRRKRNCWFCQNKRKPYWREVEVLSRFISPRARILPRRRTGVCARHQRQLAQAIKHARHLALLPFVTYVGER